MAKHNKLRYQVKPKTRVAITLTGGVFLQYEHEEAMASAGKGDLLLYPYNDALNTTRAGEYHATGFTGYFKVDVYDGRDWKPVIATEMFEDGEQHFAKKERPIDTYELCAARLRSFSGRTLVRTYREHYELENLP